MDGTKRLLAAGCYLSVLFAPFLFPIVVYFALPDMEVKQHAKRALLSHLVPYASIVVLVITWLTAGQEHLWTGAWLMVIGGMVLSFVVLVWNLVKGVQLLVR